MQEHLQVKNTLDICRTIWRQVSWPTRLFLVCLLHPASDATHSKDLRNLKVNPQKSWVRHWNRRVMLLQGDMLRKQVGQHKTLDKPMEAILIISLYYWRMVSI